MTNKTNETRAQVSRLHADSVIAKIEIYNRYERIGSTRRERRAGDGYYVAVYDAAGRFGTLANAGGDYAAAVRIRDDYNAQAT